MEGVRVVVVARVELLGVVPLFALRRTRLPFLQLVGALVDLVSAGLGRRLLIDLGLDLLVHKHLAERE